MFIIKEVASSSHCLSYELHSLCIFEYAITPSVGWDVIPGRVIAENHTWDKYKTAPHRQAKNPNVI